ncbi:hypothetical protein WA158_000429 [Blastocystis sp. Blastoise]
MDPDEFQDFLSILSDSSNIKNNKNIDYNKNNMSNDIHKSYTKECLQSIYELLSNPISILNELTVLSVLEQYSRHQLRQYKTSFTEDLNRLTSTKTLSNSFLKNSTVILKDEKQICLFYILLYTICNELYDMNQNEIEETIEFYSNYNELYLYLKSIFYPLLVYSNHSETSSSISYDSSSDSSVLSSSSDM